MNNNIWFKRKDISIEKEIRQERELLNTRKIITIKLLTLSFVLFIIFWYFFLGKLSQHFALVCSMVFLMFAGYFILILRDTLIRLGKIK